eukprot:6176432-Pleurochrysis_carterae.AAC.5
MAGRQGRATTKGVGVCWQKGGLNEGFIGRSQAYDLMEKKGKTVRTGSQTRERARIICARAEARDLHPPLLLPMTCLVLRQAKAKVREKPQEPEATEGVNGDGSV